MMIQSENLILKRCIQEKCVRLTANRWFIHYGTIYIRLIDLFDNIGLFFILNVTTVPVLFIL